MNTTDNQSLIIKHRIAIHKVQLMLSILSIHEAKKNKRKLLL